MSLNCSFCGAEIKENETTCSLCGIAVEKPSAPVVETPAPTVKEVKPEPVMPPVVETPAPVVAEIKPDPVAPAAPAIEESKFVCSGCGKEYPNGGKFCAECGGKIEEKKPVIVQKDEAPKFVCSGCGKEYPAGTKFCAECGGKVEEVKPAAPVVFACSGCGKEYPAGTKFCAECGSKVEEVKPAAPIVFACTFCGKKYPSGTKFCALCGSKVEEKNASKKSSLQREKDYKTGEDKEKHGKYRSAIEWYEKADTYNAWCRIGHIYQKGFGNVPVDMEEALNAYRKAASMEDDKQKDGFAECYLGYFYKSGNCVSRNIAEARKWFKISASYGNKYAQRELNRLGR